jgi:hypothetical protein
MRLLLILAFPLALVAGCYKPPPPPLDRPIDPPCPSTGPELNVPMFRGDRGRVGWNAAETDLTPGKLTGGSFNWLWNSQPFDETTIGGTTYAPHLYASPLYVDKLALSGGPWDGATVSAIIAATSNAWVYAVSACGRDVGGRHLAAGTILWRTQVATPDVVPSLDGGVPLGILSTPAIDLAASPPRLYAATMDRTAGWQVVALDLASGHLVPGWPVTLTNTDVNRVNTNGPSTFQTANVGSQRGALNLSVGGDRVYVPFGAYGGKSAGWLIAVDTVQPAISGAFSSGRGVTAETAFGGIWGSGGPAVAADDRVFATSGNAPPSSGPTPNLWGETLLTFDPSLQLHGTYTPWNYCQLDQADADLASSSPLLIPDLDPSETSTPHLVAFGGKQGNAYLIDRDHLPGSTTARPPCSMDPTSDASLLSPDPQPQFGTRGPVSVFGPYSEQNLNYDYARMRTTPAYFRDDSGARFIYMSGATKAAVDSTRSVSPSLVRLRLVTSPGQPAYLKIDQHDSQLAFTNPGAPVISSHGAADAIAWVLDENAPRLASLLDPATPHPLLYAVDATTLQLLWRSPENQLFVGGKYNTPVVAHGFVFVGTDRIQAYGVR